MPASIQSIQLHPEAPDAQASLAVTVEIAVTGLVFDLDCVLEWCIAGEGSARLTRHLRQDGVDISWLPPGHYRLTFHTPRLPLPPAQYQLVVSLLQQRMGEESGLDRQQTLCPVAGPDADGPGTADGMSAAWDLVAAAGAPAVEQLSWRKGHEDWFFRHFDHAARTIISYMLNNSPLLRKRVLDVGCGDGITDLGVCLRCQPEEMVGIDPFRGFDRLPGIAAENHLPESLWPGQLRFEAADANDIPYPDDHFDVVLSWGSLEHIAGGYDKALLEIRRVLKPGGLFFVHPGLYYSNFGHHLGEFSQEPFFHLTRSPEEVRDIVFNTPPSYMDRSGEFSTPEQYWQWYNELNPITVAGFEQELKDLDFELYRVALRTEDLIEYSHPKLQAYGMQDLATVELYLSAWNRK
ncbi:MAG: class I SAM-dependent methyltransferase [Xanthomonadales bacterium]|nr:class I SAM-dependent methyltransferase [Xanthomonadales bacterium]